MNPDQHIIGSDTGKTFAPGYGATQRFRPRRPSGLLLTAATLFAIIGLVDKVAIIVVMAA